MSEVVSGIYKNTAFTFEEMMLGTVSVDVSISLVRFSPSYAA